MRWLRAVRRLAPARGTYDLDLVDQWLVLLLARYGEATFRRLEAELAAIRGTPPAEVVGALLKAQGLGLVERVAMAELIATEPRFRLSRAGRRLREAIVGEPRSPTIFYV